VRLDLVVARRLACSRAAARRLIEAGAVRVDGRRGRPGTLLAAGVTVDVTALPPDALQTRPIAEPDLGLVVLHVDEALVGLDKPAGMPTHPLRAGERGTLANALVARYPECAAASDDPREGGIAHRLDVDTSGVMVAARHPHAFARLRAAFGAGAVDKEYLAMVAGAPPDSGEVDLAIAHATARTVRAVAPGGAGADQARPARTRFVTLARGAGCALVRARSSTGRMHQVRVHLAAIGHPLIGDALYGGASLPGGAALPGGAPGGHLLHAAALRLPHPTTGAPLELTAPLPARWRAIADALGLSLVEDPAPP
jgi:23S rRNA pseudouridine1911/1915/1917 synthase